MEKMIKQTEVGDYRITIRYDEGAACPLRDFSMMGCYLWEGYPKFSEIISRGDVEFADNIEDTDPYIPESSAFDFCDKHGIEFKFGDTVE